MIRLTVLVSMVGLIGCAEKSDERDHELLNGPSPTITFNALTGNALTGNALTGNALTGNALTGNALTGNALTGNALTGNALTGNALTGNALTGNGVTDGQLAREVLRYVYSCAMPAGERMTLVIGGQEYNFDGAIGLAPEWGRTPTAEHPEYGTCDQRCQRWISACVLARTNAFGIPVPISIRGNHPALANVTQAEKDLFPRREGSYYGNIFGSDSQKLSRHGCTGRASNEPALSARLCSNAGSEGNLGNPCGIDIQRGECFVAPEDVFVDPDFGGPESACTGVGPAGEVRNCFVMGNEAVDPIGPIDEVITVFLQNPQPVSGNGVCEAGETSATSGDCSPGWAKVIPDPASIVSSAGVAVDTKDHIVLAGRFTGTPSLGGAPLPSGDGGFFVATYKPDGTFVMSKRVGTGFITATAIVTDGSDNIFVAGRYHGTAHAGGAVFPPPDSQAGFLVKLSPTGDHLWSQGYVNNRGWDRLALDPAGNPVVVGQESSSPEPGIIQVDARITRVSASDGTVLGSVVMANAEDSMGIVVDAAGQTIVSTKAGVTLLSLALQVSWTKPLPRGGLAVDAAGHVYHGGQFAVSRLTYDASAASVDWTVPLITGGLLFSEDNAFPKLALGSDGNLMIGNQYQIRFAIDAFAFTMNSNEIFHNAYLAKLTPNGAVVWAKNLASPVASAINGLATSKAGGTLVVGTFNANLIVDGAALVTTRQGLGGFASELFLANVKDQLVGVQPHDRAGGAIKVPAPGNGLTIEYFDDVAFTELVGRGVDDSLRFSDLGEPPLSTMAVDTYGIRWSGTIKSDVTEPVTFHASATGAVRVWIDGTLIIDKTTEAFANVTGSFAMEARKRYDIRIDYTKTTGQGTIDFGWSSPRQAQEGIPITALSSRRTHELTGTTAGLGDDYQASCGGAGGGDVVYQFRLTEPARVRLDTAGSGYDPVLYVRDGSTTAGEVACNAGGANGKAALDVTLGPGTYLVVVDGKGEGAGYKLALTFDTPSLNATDATATFVSDTANGGRFHGTITGTGNDRAGSCGGSDGADAAYRLVLTKPRRLHVDTNGSDFDTVLYVRDASSERACSDDFDATKQSAVDVDLPPGTYFVHVDGKGVSTGTFRADFHLQPAIDITKPVFVDPPNINVVATAASGNVVTYALPTATDNLDPELEIACTPVSGSRFAIGKTTVTCTATDDANNVGTTSFTVSVTYSFSGLLAPVNADGSSVFKRGSTIPLKFRLTGASASITNAVAKITIAKFSNAVLGDEVEAVTTSAATTGNLFRYDTTAGQYVFNLGTKGLSVGTYQIRIDLGDGVSHVAIVSIN